MTAGPSGVNETLSERCFRPFASKTRELSGLGARSVSEGAIPTIKFHPSEASPQTDERCLAELSCNALPRLATESGSRPRYLAPKVHQDNSPGHALGIGGSTRGSLKGCAKSNSPLTINSRTSLV